MSKNYDEETLLDDVLQIMQDNLPAKITEINSEKSDSITLESIPNNRYLETLNEDALNMPVFIYYGILNIVSTGIASATSMEVTVFFDVLFMDDQSSFGNVARRAVQRYTRAMREVVQENFRKINRASDLEVNSLSPVNLRDVEDTNYYKVAGIQLTATIG